MIKILLIVLLAFTWSLLPGQVGTIKVRKNSSESFSYKNDTCAFVINIDKRIYGKTLTLHSVDLDDAIEPKMVQSLPFRKFIFFIGESVEIKTLAIQAMCLDMCKIGIYKLKAANVTSHITTNERYKNRFDIYLVYEAIK